MPVARSRQDCFRGSPTTSSRRPCSGLWPGARTSNTRTSTCKCSSGTGLGCPLISSCWTMANALPAESWKSAIREGIAGIVEDLGRVRNFYMQADYTNFRLFSVLVALGMAKVYADLGRHMLRTEKDLNTVFEKGGGPDCEAARAYRVAARLVDASEHDTMDGLEWLSDFLTREALKQSAMPQTCKSARSYIPP